MATIVKTPYRSPFRFNFPKTLQAIATLLRREASRQMNYMRLIKLLYIADRECLREIRRPLTGSHVVAMKRGPVLEDVLHLIRGEHIQTPEWSKYLHRNHFSLELIADPGLGDLSYFEVEKLEEIAERYAENDEWDLVNITHEFAEWQKNDPGDSSKPIPLDDILAAVGHLDEKSEITKDAETEALIAQAFGE